MFSLLNFTAASSQKNSQKMMPQCGFEFQTLHVPLICLFPSAQPRTSLFNAPYVYFLNNYVIEIQVLLSAALH